LKVTEEDLDSEALVFRHIDRVLRTASMDLESLSDGGGGQKIMDTQTWSHRVLYSAEFFHAFLRPSMDEEKFNEIEAKAQEPVDDFSVPFEKVRYAKRIFKHDVQHLHEENMVFQESDDLVIEDESEEKLEPESSDVDEEVIE